MRSSSRRKSTGLRAPPARQKGPAGRALAPGRYAFEALQPGDRWATDGLLVTDWHLLTFAGLSGDFFAPHMDDVAAQELGFSNRIAHGLLILGLVDGLKNRAPVQLAAIASLGWTWEFRRPVHSGDRIFAVENVCSHAEQPLDCGRVRAGWVACPFHGSRFDLETGEALHPPATEPIATFPVRVNGDSIEIAV